MKSLVQAALVAVSLLVLAFPGFAADVAVPAKDAKAAKAGDAVKQDAAKGKGKMDAVKTAVKAALVDINSASDAELKAIPGIGDAYAAKIIAGRPYANKTQLKSRKILPANVYEQVKDKIIAKLVKK